MLVNSLHEKMSSYGDIFQHSFLRNNIRVPISLDSDQALSPNCLRMLWSDDKTGKALRE